MEVPLQISAGADSTAVTIRGTMLHLLSSPGAYNKLKDEIRTGIKQRAISRPIKGDEAKKLSYLQVSTFYLDLF
jgi:cytochrome P450